MRIVSWIVVVGALAWLLYAQLSHHYGPETLDDISGMAVSGTVTRVLTDPRTADGAAAEAGIAYAALFPVLEASAAADDLDRIHVVALVQSRQAGVDPDDIVLTLDDGGQSHEFSVRPDGVVELPLRPDWRAADLRLRSNQPAGSLDFQVAFLMRELPGPRVEYAWLWESAQQVESAMATVHDAQGLERGEPADVVALVFEFAPDARGTVRAGEGPGSAVFVADDQGRLRLALTPELLAANPTLAFSTMPRRVVPLVAPVADSGGRDTG